MDAAGAFGARSAPGGRPRRTRNARGIENAEPSPWLEEWAASGDVLADVGCAFGLNVARVTEMAPDGTAIWALDCEPAHLEEVDALGLGARGVSTALCRLPGTLPLGNLSVNGLLCSEVLHFLTPAEIEASLREFHRVLAPGGRLFISACSPYYNLTGSGCPIGAAVRALRASGDAAGERWPNGGGVSFAAIMAAHKGDTTRFTSALGLSPDRIGEVQRTMSSYMHNLGDELVDAVREAGFFVVCHKYSFRRGYLETNAFDGRECIQIHALKECADGTHYSAASSTSPAVSSARGTQNGAILLCF